jgi:sugar porter (SP) family MFS transporter
VESRTLLTYLQWINYGIQQTLPANHAQWLIPFAVQLIPAGLLLIGAFWIRESPRWLLSKHRREEALKNLSWIRKLPADDLYMVEEIASLDLVLETQAAAIGEGFWQPFKAAARDRKVQWRLFLGSIMFMWQNGSGINAINYYSPRVFASIGIRGTSTSFLTTGIFGVVKTTMTIVWILVLIDHLGRRKLLMIGAGGGAVCMFIIGAYILHAGVDPNSDAELSSGGIAAVFFFYLWTVFYTPSWNGTPWVINSEIFDNNTRALGQACAAASNWFWNFIISRFTQQMFDTMGPSGCGVYFFFASMMICSIVFVFFLLPETKGIPLESMDRLFEVKPVWKANKLILEEERLREEEFRDNADAVGVEMAVAKGKDAHNETV